MTTFCYYSYNNIGVVRLLSSLFNSSLETYDRFFIIPINSGSKYVKVENDIQRITENGKNQTIDASAEQVNDVLIIDDSKKWQEIIKETLENYRCDTALSYEEAMKMIQDNKYRFICLSYPFISPLISNKVIEELKDKRSDIPIIWLPDTFDIFNNVKEKYFNVKQIISKESDFVPNLKNILKKMR